MGAVGAETLVGTAATATARAGCSRFIARGGRGAARGNKIDVDRQEVCPLALNPPLRLVPTLDSEVTATAGTGAGAAAAAVATIDAGASGAPEATGASPYAAGAVGCCESPSDSERLSVIDDDVNTNPGTFVAGRSYGSAHGGGDGSGSTFSFSGLPAELASRYSARFCGA